MVVEKGFDYLDAPIQRVGARDVPMPYNDGLEVEVIPSIERIATRSAMWCGDAGGSRPTNRRAGPKLLFVISLKINDGNEQSDGANRPQGRREEILQRGCAISFFAPVDSNEQRSVPAKRNP